MTSKVQPPPDSRADDVKMASIVQLEPLIKKTLGRGCVIIV